MTFTKFSRPSTSVGLLKAHRAVVMDLLYLLGGKGIVVDADSKRTIAKLLTFQVDLAT